MTLPSDARVKAYIGLAGLDGGLIAWTVFKMKSARGDMQHAIATFMIILQLFGVGLTSVGDALIHQNIEAMPEYVKTAVVWGVPLIIITNVAAITAVHLSDPRQEIERAQRNLEDEIEKSVAEHLRQNAAQIAAKVAPKVAEHRAEELTAPFFSMLSEDGHRQPSRAKTR